VHVVLEGVAHPAEHLNASRGVVDGGRPGHGCGESTCSSVSVRPSASAIAAKRVCAWAADAAISMSDAGMFDGLIHTDWLAELFAGLGVFGRQRGSSAARPVR